MELRPDEYGELTRIMEELETELDSYLDSTQLIVKKSDLSELHDKIIDWRARVNEGIKSARMEATQNKWQNLVENVMKKIDEVEQIYLNNVDDRMKI